MSRHDLEISWTVIHFNDLVFVFGVSSVLQNLSRALQTIPSHSSQCLCRTTLLAAIPKIISVAQTSFSILRRDRSNLLVKTSNNLKTLLGVNHFLRGIPVRSIFFEQGKFFQTPCIFAPQFQISYFLGKISDLFSRFIPDPLKLQQEIFQTS